MCDFDREKTLENIIDTQNETIKSYHLIMVALEHEIEKLKARKDRPRGEWRRMRKFDSFEEYYECPVCGTKVNMQSNYCPNCGAKMERVKP